MPEEMMPEPAVSALLGDVRKLIEDARQRAAVAVNREMTLHIGKRIRQDILGEERAAYGAQIIATLSRRLTLKYGRGFGRTNLLYMIQFAEVFSDTRIVQSLIGQLSWTHFLLLLPIKDHLKREFYAEMCRLERWSVRTLRSRIDGMLFERTTLSGQPEAVIDAGWPHRRNESRRIVS